MERDPLSDFLEFAKLKGISVNVKKRITYPCKNLVTGKAMLLSVVEGSNLHKKIEEFNQTKA
jgi:hypothetical protein